ncbi:MAG: AAA family ATPase [Planctomycetota bacterium]|jgi:DNA transposition AAA+ family ATPase
MKKPEIDGLERDARLQLERLGENPSAEDLERVADLLRLFMDANDLSQGQVGSRVGLSRTTIAQFLAGRYKGNVQKVANKIIALFNSVDRKGRRVKYAGFVETTVAKMIGTLVTQTDAFSADEGKIGLIIGDGGHGKSICLQQYARANRLAVYVALDETMSSTAMFRAIGAGLKIACSGSLAAVTSKLILNLKARHAVIMLDEASALAVKQLNQLRQIIAVKARCPLVLAGNAQLLQTVMQPTTRRGHESLDQFRSRLMMVLNLDELALDGDGGLYTAQEIRWLYEFGGIRLRSDAVKTLQDICRTPQSGRLRTCSHIIAALHTAGAVEKQGYIDARVIRRVIKQLRLPVAAWLPMVLRESVQGDHAKGAVQVG